MLAYQNLAPTEVWRLLGSLGDSILMPVSMLHGLNFHSLIVHVEYGGPSP